MSEWWTYRPSDFLMFAPRIYWRLFASINEAWWPLPWLAVGAGAAWLVAAQRQRAPGWRTACAVLAAAWAFVAWEFLYRRFAPIQWVAAGFAWGFAAQAICLLALATRSRVEGCTSRRRRLAAGLLGVWAVWLHPLLAPLQGRPWPQAEVLGLAPDPTAIGTLAVLLAWQPANASTRRLYRVAASLALAWCVISAATLATMGSWQALVTALAAGLALTALRLAPPAR